MATYIHPQALVESEQIGDNSKIWAFTHILPGVTIGENCNICDYVFIESGVTIGKGVTIKTHVSVWTGVIIEDYCFIGPNVAFTNDLYPRSHRNPEMQERYFTSDDDSWYRAPTLIAEGASLGANSTILCGVTVGYYAMVAAGAVVTRDIKPFELVGGVPARHLGWVDKQGRKTPEQTSDIMSA
ncbi:MAG: N-acetyltransferase [Symploca sp. SIO2G7]|nr:N-acetyltransferase [Symploca sp. SIO2G7]